MTGRKKLSLTIALDTLNHLGMNLYSSLPPVVSEVVGNACDARARRVDITLSEDGVMIEDEGIGMERGGRSGHPGEAGLSRGFRVKREQKARTGIEKAL